MLNLIFDLICHSDFDLSRLVHVGVNPPSIRHIMQAQLWHLRHKDARPQAGQTGTFCICSTDGEFKPRCTSYGYGINDNGDVVGASLLANRNGQDAFLYSDDRMIDLNTLLSADSGWQLFDARGINNSGWITGTGIINGQQHAYILRPNAVPEAGGAWVLGIGCWILGAAGLRKRRQS